MNAGNVVKRGEPMTDSVQEQLSACLDGELPKAELDLLVKRVARDEELAATIGRYALVSEALRGETPAMASRGFAAKVMVAIEQEPAGAVSRPAARSRRTSISPTVLRYLRPAGGLAVAAGVAAVAVLTVQQMGGVPGEVAGPQTIASTETPVSVTSDVVSAPDGPSYVVPTSTSAPAFVPATRLTNYVVAHSEYSSPLGRRSVLSGVLAEDDSDPAADDAAAVEAQQQPQER